MPDNDEPLDDLRAVAMTAGAAAARVVETVMREQQNRVQQTHEAQGRYNGIGAAPATPQSAATQPGTQTPGVDQPTDVDKAKAWATPKRRNDYELEWSNADTQVGRRSAESSLLSDWKASTGYDGQRPERDAAMRAAGVPDEARQARTTADLLNGTDPATAAASGTRTPARPSRTAKTPVRERLR